VLLALSLVGLAVAAEPATGAGVRVESLGSEPLVVTAPSSSWELGSRAARFEGGVDLQRGAFSLTCQTLDLAFDERGRIVSATARGDVRVERDPWVATGQVGTLTAASGLLVLEGEPRVSDGQSSLSGRLVELHLDQERVDCQDCQLVVDLP
jgi:lipopolysaccharide export system protein LptA